MYAAFTIVIGFQHPPAGVNLEIIFRLAHRTVKKKPISHFFFKTTSLRNGEIKDENFRLKVIIIFFFFNINDPLVDISFYVIDFRMMKICLTLQSSNYIFLFTNICIPEEEIFETVPRTVVKLLYRQLRAGNYVFVGRARRNGRIER